MIKINTTVINEAGIHARPAGMLVKEACKFKSHIEIEKTASKKRINAKSIMGIMSLGASSGTEMTLYIEGPDEELAKEALLELFETGFGELK